MSTQVYECSDTDVGSLKPTHVHNVMIIHMQAEYVETDINYAAKTLQEITLPAVGGSVILSVNRTEVVTLSTTGK